LIYYEGYWPDAMRFAKDPFYELDVIPSPEGIDFFKIP
jgi:hypothetical protein